MTPLKTTILATTLLLSTQAQNALKQYQTTRGNATRGVRSIGNGGGFGEMQALWIEQQLSKLSEPCAKDPSLCNLTMEETQNLQKAVGKNFRIQISPDCPADPIFEVTAERATLATCALYRIPSPGATPEVLSFSDVSTWVLTAHLISEGLTLDQAFTLASKVFSQYQQSLESILISLDDGEVLAHLLQIQMGSRQTPQISLEGRNRTVAVTDRLLRLLPCTNPQIQFGPLDYQVLSNQQALLQSQVNWICDHEAWSGKWQLFFATDAGDINEASLNSRIVEKRRTR